MDVVHIKPTRIERIEHPDGRVDVKVHVSKVEFQAKVKELKSNKE